MSDKTISNPNLTVIDLDTDWVVLGPGDLQIDEDFVLRARDLVQSQTTTKNTVFCGAGIYPYKIGKNQSKLISFAFDQINSPTSPEGGVRVLMVLEGPVVTHNELLKRFLISKEAKFDEFLKVINSAIESGMATALAESTLTFGLPRKLGSNRRLSSYRTFHVPNPAKLKISVITRTMGSRPTFLRNCIESVEAFRAQITPFEVEHIIVHGGKSFEFADIGKNKIVKNSYPHDTSRFGGLVEGLANSTGSHIIFLDDDDEINADLAPKIREFLSFDSKPRIIFFDSVQVFRSGKQNSPKRRLGHRYRAENAPYSLYGPNRTPISSVIYPRDVFEKLFDHNWRENAPKVLEDYFLFHWAMRFSENDEVFIPEILSFISIHGLNQTVTKQDAQIWNESMSAIRRLTSVSGVLGPTRDFIHSSTLFRLRSKKILNVMSMFRLFYPSTFRVIRGFGIPAKLVRRELSFRELINKFLNH